MNKESILFSTNAQKVLAFYLERPDEKFYDAQVSTMTGISRAGTNLALRKLALRGYLECEKQGRMRFYQLSKDNYLVRQYKVLHLLKKMQVFYEKIRPFAIKLVLYGSQSKGTSGSESDIDLLIITRDQKKVRQIIHKSKFAAKIRPIIKTPVEMISFKKNNEELIESINEGIVLWEEITD